MKTGNETTLIASCLHLLAVCDVPAWRNNSGGAKIGNRFIRFGQVGAPDIFAIRPGSGQLLCIEAKVGRNHLTKLQAAWLDRAAAAGAVCLVIHDIAELAAWLRSEGLLQ